MSHLLTDVFTNKIIAAPPFSHARVVRRCGVRWGGAAVVR